MAQRFAPFARPVPRHDRPDVVPEGAADPPPFDDYPPIEQFLDELPSIDDYVLKEPAQFVDRMNMAGLPVAIDNRDDATHDSEGWAISGWQSYDWTGLAALGKPLLDTPDTQWGLRDWPSSGRSAATSGSAGAEDVAQALDDIAGRIRSGELPIDHLSTSQPEAAVAAALAAILRLRG